MAWTVISQFLVNARFGFQSAERIRGNLITLASRRAGRSLGGSREIPNNFVMDTDDDSGGELHSLQYGVGPYDAYDYVDVEIDGTEQTGITYRARVEVRVLGPNGFTITPKIRNITDSTDAGTGTACSASEPDYSGTDQRQTITLTIASGVKKYRLMYTLSGPTGDSWVKGEIESFATA